MDLFDTLKQLTETAALSGGEAPVREVIASLWEPLVDEMITDRIGSLIAIKHGSGDAPRRKLLLAAHADEIGLMVKQIVEYKGWGFLRVVNIGGIDRRHIYGQLVTAHGERDLNGVLGCLPAAMLPEARRNKPFGYEDVVVDVGLPYEELKELVHIGDYVSFRQPLRKLQGGLASGKAVDNRASVTAVTHCLKLLQERDHTWDVVAVATAQEETRLLGAYTSAHSQQPDAAIAIDVGFGKGPGVSSNDPGVQELGSGPVLGLGSNVHPGMRQALVDAADALEMKTTIDTHTRGSGTDAFGLQVAREGVPTGLISIPLRYMHTVVETVSVKDIQRAGRLMAELVTRLDDSFLTKLAEGLMEANG